MSGEGVPASEDVPPSERGTAMTHDSTIAICLRSIDAFRQGGSRLGDGSMPVSCARATGFVRAVPVSCAPCPFRPFVDFLALTVVPKGALLFV